MKCLQTIALLFFIATSAFANGIDSLQTEQQVRKFLKDNLAQSGLIVLRECVGIPQVIKFSRHEWAVDSIPVTASVTGATIIRTVRNEYDGEYSCGAGYGRSYLNFPFENISELTDSFHYKFYKADIDGNGRTDMVVDARLFSIIVMDMAGRIEGHILSTGRQWEYDRFYGFASLPGGDIGLRFGHKFEPCDFEGKNVTAADVTAEQLTDTIVYKFHGFAKYNPRFKPGGIAKVDYYWERSAGLIPPPAYVCSEISANGQCLLRCLEMDNTWTATIETARLSDLWNFIAYADLPSKEDNYFCLSAHGQGSIFAIHFSDGTVKKISFFEHDALTDLGYLSKNIADIIVSLQWRLTNNRPGFECPCELPPCSESMEFDTSRGIIPGSCDCR